MESLVSLELSYTNKITTLTVYNGCRYSQMLHNVVIDAVKLN